MLSFVVGGRVGEGSFNPVTVVEVQAARLKFWEGNRNPDTRAPDGKSGGEK